MSSNHVGHFGQWLGGVKCLNGILFHVILVVIFVIYTFNNMGRYKLFGKFEVFIHNS
jgi:hypothetical protein